MTRRRACGLGRLLALLLCVAEGAFASPHPSPPSPDKPSFGPWAAGERRAVRRQGEPGLSRAAHPMVGDPAKVPATGPAAPPPRRDDDVPETADVAPNRVGSALQAHPLSLAALVYAELLTELDGPRCQHLPTCSRFASQALASHGAPGLLMGLDRLIQDHLSSAVRRLPEIPFGGQMRLYDPVANYEPWRVSLASPVPPRVAEEPWAPPAPPPETPAPRAPRESGPETAASDSRAPERPAPGP